MNRLSNYEVLALGFMTFALFLGAGNIIVPAEIGMKAGAASWAATLGFLVTAVSMPLLTVVALARAGGGMAILTSPVGKLAGIIFAVAIYLAIGPFFGTPRTAAVSFEIGITPFLSYLPFVNPQRLDEANYMSGIASNALWFYSSAYFALVFFLVLTPSKIVDRLGKVLTPALLIGLAILGLSAIFAPAGEMGPIAERYQSMPALSGFLDGYLTMDALAALVFGLVIANAVRSKGITDKKLVTRYCIMAGLIGAIGLSLVYLALINLGATSYSIAFDAENGGRILTLYVQHTFGPWGLVLLATVIILACITTAVGLITACGEYFNELTGLSYRTIVLIVTLFSWLVSNVGLTDLLAFSIPALVGLYPLSVVLVLLSLAHRLWKNPRVVFIPTLLVTLILGIFDGLAQAKLNYLVPDAISQLWGAKQQLGWVLPVAYTLLASVLVDRLLARFRSASLAARES